MLEAWRIVKAKHADHAFDGEGARLFGGRWSSRGRRAVYTSASVALATLEVLVHLEATSVLPSFVVIKARIPEAMVQTVPSSALPKDWREYPAPLDLQAIGNAWIEAGRAAVLRVPSVIVPTEWNYLLNPAHKDFAKIKRGKPEPHVLDMRLRRVK